VQVAHASIPRRGGVDALDDVGSLLLAFYGDPGASGKINPQNDAGRLPFTVEFRP